MEQGVGAGPKRIAALYALAEEHTAALEADLARYYPQPADQLGGLFTGALSWRRLDVLVQHLPPESALKTALRDGMDEADFDNVVAEPRRGHGPWSNTDMLLASVYDAIQRLTYVQYQRAGAKVPAPEPLARPGVKSNVKAINPAAAAYLAGLRERRGASA